MPFIDSKITIPLTREQKDTLKTRLGQAVSIIGKPEFYLMVGIDDDYDLYMGGNRVEKGAFVSVSLYGGASSSAYNKMTAAICNILEEELGIPGNTVYVSYQGTNYWGWQGSNF
jgi:hypothetical protein